MFTETDISDLSTKFYRSTQANGKIHFWVKITKKMKSLLHWVQAFYWISVDPTIVEINKVMFIKQLDTALYRVEIRYKLIDQSNTSSSRSIGVRKAI